MTNPEVYLSRIHYPVRALGPGSRIGIWFQGCSIKCPGCISMDTWATGKGLTHVGTIMTAIQPYLEVADGITISGGEPFDQVTALSSLLKAIRQKSSGDILVYTGYSLDTLPLSDFETLIDAIISEPFVLEAPQTKKLRGSDNQKLTLLTPLGERLFSATKDAGSTSSPSLDIMFDDTTGEIFMAGIPLRGDLQRLTQLLSEAGHTIKTTQDRRYQ